MHDREIGSGGLRRQAGAPPIARCIGGGEGLHVRRASRSRAARRGSPRRRAGRAPSPAAHGWRRPCRSCTRRPALTATPARSSAITWVSARTPGSARQVVFGRRGAPAPQTMAPDGDRGLFGGIAQRAQAVRHRRLPPGPPRRTRRSSGDRRRAAAAAALLAAAGDQRRVRTRVRRPAAGRPTPAGPPSLCDEIARLSAPSAAIDRHAAGGLDRIHMQQGAVARGRARRPRRPAGSRAGFVVGQHQADQRRRPSASTPPAHPDRPRRRLAPAARWRRGRGAHRVVLGGADDDAPARATSRGSPAHPPRCRRR